METSRIPSTEALGETVVETSHGDIIVAETRIKRVVVLGAEQWECSVWRGRTQLYAVTRWSPEEARAELRRWLRAAAPIEIDRASVN